MINNLAFFSQFQSVREDDDRVERVLFIGRKKGGRLGAMMYVKRLLNKLKLTSLLVLVLNQIASNRRIVFLFLKKITYILHVTYITEYIIHISIMSVVGK